MAFSDPLEARIVVVDDQQRNVDVLTALLAGWGYTNVVSTTDSSQALALCRRHDPHLLLLDLHMPAPDGLEVLAEAARLPEYGPKLPIIILTADPSEDAKTRALTAGARDFLTKPFSPVEARLRIANQIETNMLQRYQEAQNELLAVTVQERTWALGRAQIQTLERLARAGEYRDDETHEHAQRVGRTAALLAEKLGLRSTVVEHIRLAAPLHDLGKIAVPDAILLKPGRLTAAEFEVIKRHAQVGHDLLSGEDPILQLSAEIALTHHERWDGQGYPNGLAGEAIPISGRIVAVCDAFDAMTHERPYKEAWPVERALAEIESQASAQFCPRVVRCFAELDRSSLVADSRDAHWQAA